MQPRPRRRMEDRDLSRLGELYVQLELIKRGFRTLKVFDMGYDLLGENGEKLEVKTALPNLSASRKRRGEKVYTYTYRKWLFRITTERQKKSDFFVCVVLTDVQTPPREFFVFPRGAVSAIEKSGLFVLYESDIDGEFKRSNKLDRHRFMNRWDLLTREGGANGASAERGDARPGH